MRLLHADEIPEDEQDLVCRQSRLAGTLGLVVWGVMLSIAPVIGVQKNLPWVLWIGVIVAALIMAALLKDLTLRFRKTNWVLRVGRDGVWVNLLSYSDKPSPDVSVMHLDYEEIASGGKHTEVYTTPSKSTSTDKYRATCGSTEWKDEFLEFQLTDVPLDELKNALRDLRTQTTQSQTSPSSIPGHCRPPAVWLVSPSVIRIPWLSGHGRAVLPTVTQALGQLATYVGIAEPNRRERGPWRNLKPDEIDELARELVQVHGATLEANSLLIRVGGLAESESTARLLQFERDALA